MRDSVSIARPLLLLLLCFFAPSLPGKDLRSFRKRVEWNAGHDAPAWHRAITDMNGQERYRVTLLPLWAVEGGIVAIEIVLARSDRPNDNLLGDRQNDVAQPFVITVEQLASGIEKSAFGAKRIFRLPKPDNGQLQVDILGWNHGRGVGLCDDCPNIQGLNAIVSVDAK